MKQYHGYTIEDMVAMGEARGVFYGDIQQHLEYGKPLPPLKHSVKWPRGSAHRGEQILGPDGTERNMTPRRRQKPEEAAEAEEQPKHVGWSKPVSCSACGASVTVAESVKLYILRGAAHNGKYSGSICRSCEKTLLPFPRPTRRDMYSGAGVEPEGGINKRQIASCFRCGKPFTKETGIRIYAAEPGEGCRYLRGYVCADCRDDWELDAKKAQT